MEIGTIIVISMILVGLILSSIAIGAEQYVGLIGVIIMIIVFWVTLHINNEEITEKATQQTYQKALTHNPYKMIILYDTLNQPRDTIYELKE